MKSIKLKIIGIIVLLITFVCVFFGVLSYKISSSALMNDVESQLPELAVSNSERVSTELDVHWNGLETLATNNAIINWESSWEEASVLLNNELVRNGGTDIAVVDLQGNTKSPISDSINVSTREYFLKAISGFNSVSDPIISSLDNSFIMVYVVPIKDGDKIVGALLEIRDGSDFCDYVRTITYGESGIAFIINKEGTIIAHADADKVINMENASNNLKTDPSLAGLVALEKKMINKEQGYGAYSYNNINKVCGYAPISNTDWSIAITAESSEILSGLDTLKVAIMGITILLLFVGIIVAVLFGGLIARPIVTMSKHLELIADGDFTHPVSKKTLKLNDEIGMLAKILKNNTGSYENYYYRNH